mgnify:CR=1 FL=1
MARMPRLVVPGYPHHVTQRGNRRMKTFFCDGDYQYYLELLSEYKGEAEVEIWAYCLMPNHTHIVVVPGREDSLACLFRKVHRHYSRLINFREKWIGHLWQERFHSFVMDEQHLVATVRYVELNTLRAKLCNDLSEWSWSSFHSHMSGIDDGIVTSEPMLQRVGNWKAYISSEYSLSDDQIRMHGRTGRPAGDEGFIHQLESLTGRKLKKRKPGRKPKNK